MADSFHYWMPVRIQFGTGATRRIGEWARGERILIISDPFLYNNGSAKRIGEGLKGKQVEYFRDVEPNPSCESVDAAAKTARDLKADVVIGIGGGSSLDMAKIVSCLTTNEGSIYDYYAGGTRQLKERAAQLICIPTTAGTGSEVTNVGVFTNREKGIKMPMVNDRFWPDMAVVDPEMTYTLPAGVTASTGMDAFCHAIEAYWNKESVPICDSLSLGAMKLILANIKKAYDHPGDGDARSRMILASLIAGISFSQTRTTGIHALSFPLTTEFGASHGTACSVTLPAFIRLCGGSCPEKMEDLARELGFADTGALADHVEELMRSMGMPVRLGQLGVGREDLEHITRVGLGAAIIGLTPAEMNERTVYALLESIL